MKTKHSVRALRVTAALEPLDGCNSAGLLELKREFRIKTPFTSLMYAGLL